MRAILKKCAVPAILSAALAVTGMPMVAHAEDAADPYEGHLLGNWGGILPYLSEKGIETELILTHDVIGNTSGGLDTGTSNLGNVDLTFTVDAGKVGLWDNGTFFFYVLGDYGDDPTEKIGDVQVTDNIEAYNTAKLYEAWYEHSFMDGKFSVLAGLHDYNSEFDVLEYAGGLIHGAFGLQSDIAQAGPSVFSTTSVALRAKVLPTEDTYVQAAVYDGIPGDPNDPRGTHIRFKSGDGVFVGFEGGLAGGEDAEYAKLALGGWVHTAEYEDFAGNARDYNAGVYMIGEKRVYSEEDATQGLGLFFQVGFADPDRNAFGSYFGFGGRYVGIIPGRDTDALNIGFLTGQYSDDYQDSVPGLDSSESVLETSYNIDVLPYLGLSPIFQYVWNPGSEPGLEDAVVVGLRAELAL